MDSSSVHRTVTVKPAMCGHNSLFVGQLGDWTWETVTELCHTDVFNARNESGSPTYLAFYYYRIQASPRMHLRSFSFGDRLDVASRSFNYGSESVLTLHRVSHSDGGTIREVDPREFYEDRRDDCMYVENFNRWITRSKAGSNKDLVRSSPVGFTWDHLPTLDERYSPRLAYQSARVNQTFHDPDDPDYVLKEKDFEVEYPIDITRDINGVGLVYFASYFSVIDWALLRLWRHLGRDDRSFLDRVVTDHRLCYLGNAQLDSVLRIRLSVWESLTEPAQEVVNVVIEDRDAGTVIAVSTLWLRKAGAA